MSIAYSDGTRVPRDAHAPPRDLLTRVADDIPIVSVHEHRVSLRPASDLYAAIVAEAAPTGLELASGEPPIAVAVPGWWSTRVLDRVRESLADHGVHALLVNDAEAAIAQAAHDGHSFPEHIAVVGLHADHASVVLVENTVEHPTALLSPALVHEEGGRTLDAAVLQHIVRGLRDLGDGIDPEDPDTIAAARAVVEQCRALREDLSATVTESILVDIPGAEHRIRLVRSELEAITAPWVDSILRMLRSALEQCSAPVETVLLTGGLARMPLISQRISADLALDVRVPEEPELIAVRGAERILTRRAVTGGRHRLAFWKPRRSRETPGLVSVPLHRPQEERLSPDEVDHTYSADSPEIAELLSSIISSHTRHQNSELDDEARTAETAQLEKLIGVDNHDAR